MGQMGLVYEITGTTTYKGSGSLFWIYIHATANTTVTISDDSTEKMSLYQVKDTSGPMCTFTPALRVGTSLVIAVSGTAKVSLCHNI